MEIIIIKQFLFMECRKTAIPIYCLWDISWVNFELVRTSGTIRGYSISGTLRDHFSTANWTIVKVREIGNGTIEAMINHWVKSFERYLSFYSYQFSYFDCNPWSLFLGGISSYDSSYDQFERFCIHNVCMKIEHSSGADGNVVSYLLCVRNHVYVSVWLDRICTNIYHDQLGFEAGHFSPRNQSR